MDSADEGSVGQWREVLHERFAQQAVPTLVLPTGIRSAASLWSGARLWTAVFRSESQRRTVATCWPDAELGIQLLIAVLWDGLDLVLCETEELVRRAVEQSPDTLWGVTQVASHKATPGMCIVHAGGWPAVEPVTERSATPAGVLPRASMVATALGRQSTVDWLPHIRAASMSRPEGAYLRLPRLPAYDACSADTLLRAYLLPLFVADEVWSADLEPG